MPGVRTARLARCDVCGGAFDAGPDPTDSEICGTLGIGGAVEAWTRMDLSVQLARAMQGAAEKLAGRVVNHLCDRCHEGILLADEMLGQQWTAFWTKAETGAAGVQ